MASILQVSHSTTELQGRIFSINENNGRRDFYVRTESPLPSSSHRILDQREGLHFLRKNTNGGVSTPLIYLELTKLLILSASASIFSYEGNGG